MEYSGGMSDYEVTDSTMAGPMTKTVLIVEDNDLNMKLFHDLLDAHGYQTIADPGRIAGAWSSHASIIPT